MNHNGCMPKRLSKVPRDLNKLASFIIESATDEDMKAIDDGKNPAAVLLGRMGGLKGGKARAEKLSPKRKKEIAQQAAQARWSKKSNAE